ncbi:SDR family oxidoreductase [Paraburkholderia aspalathi]|uniref:Oxidoreductase UcpA n=1 Tax=Paraburkholderia nemoris TaxID=2793076 RepID=A0ABM8S4D1_9BURK|nr:MULTISPECIES: SDR family NAD(P)-dependent oxidoreductase [Paraburkholderia]MBK3812894.1 SDR family oxidoreductase [Paraburkholderia aspalathi]CAE6788329.1 Oxidoreductase UcpA [Paraburkholderia nemoris]
MRIPSLVEPRSGRKLEGRHVVLFGAGTANDIGKGWSLRQESDHVYGVGKATALVYARHGAVVTCVDIDLEAASATAELIRSEGGRACAIACNATRSHEVKEAIERSLAYHGRIDVLHNNIGIAKMGGPVECPEEIFDEVIAVNLKSVFLTCKWVLPVMEKQGSGAIVNISSFAATRFTVPWIGYAASKGGVNAMTMGIAAQYAPKGIRCNAIAPGLLSTPMVQSAHKDNHDGLADMMRTRDESVPMGWQGEGWDVGEAAAFLASDEARFVTGQVLVVDGGSTVVMPGKPWCPSNSASI